MVLADAGLIERLAQGALNHSSGGECAAENTLAFLPLQEKEPLGPIANPWNSRPIDAHLWPDHLEVANVCFDDFVSERFGGAAVLSTYTDTCHCHTDVN
jgi:hypothetical protein